VDSVGTRACFGIARVRCLKARALHRGCHTVIGLRPFWRYYGGKWRAAPKYSPPRHATIIEPFAGAAGYSLRYPDRQVVLVEKYPVIAEIWRWLIAATPDEVRAIPCVDAVADLPAWVPDGARWLVGFNFGAQLKRPQLNLSSGLAKRRDRGWCEGWTPAMRERVALQVPSIKHWRVIEGDYSAAPDVEATWFVDAPYQVAGQGYVHGSGVLDYAALARWCRERRGQAIVCEAVGADWLPFAPFRSVVGMCGGVAGVRSHEAIWTRDGDITRGAA
jgi:hypothetical protein